MAEPGELSIDVDASSGDEAVIHLDGELNAEGAPEFRSVLLALTDTDLVIDLSALEFIDSSGLSALVAAYKQARARGRELTLRAPRPRVATVLEIAGLDALFTIQGEADSPEADG